MIEDAGLYEADDGMYCMVCEDKLETYVHVPEPGYDDVFNVVCITCALLHHVP